MHNNIVPVGDGPIAKALAEKIAEQLMEKMIEDGTLEKVYEERKEEILKGVFAQMRSFYFLQQPKFKALLDVKAEEIAKEFLGDDELQGKFKKSFLEGIINYFRCFGTNKMKKVARKAEGW